jgi:hypothetical protein
MQQSISQPRRGSLRWKEDARMLPVMLVVAAHDKNFKYRGWYSKSYLASN